MGVNEEHNKIAEENKAAAESTAFSVEKLRRVAEFTEAEKYHDYRGRGCYPFRMGVAFGRKEYLNVNAELISQVQVLRNELTIQKEKYDALLDRHRATFYPNN